MSLAQYCTGCCCWTLIHLCVICRPSEHFAANTSVVVLQLDRFDLMFADARRALVAQQGTSAGRSPA